MLILWSPKLSWLTGIHYKHIHTIKNSRNQVEPLLKPPKTQLSLEVNLAYDIPLIHEREWLASMWTVFLVKFYWKRPPTLAALPFIQPCSWRWPCSHMLVKCSLDVKSFKWTNKSFLWNGWGKIPMLAIKRLITSTPVNLPTT